MPYPLDRTNPLMMPNWSVGCNLVIHTNEIQISKRTDSINHDTGKEFLSKE